MTLNPQRDRHLAEGMGEMDGGSHPQSIHIYHAGPGKPHPGNPHHVHIHHADGTHEHSDHANFSEAMNHVNARCSGGEQRPENAGGEGEYGSSVSE